MAVMWGHIFYSNLNMRGQTILSTITDIGPPQRRNPETKMLDSLVIPIRDMLPEDPGDQWRPPQTRYITVIPFRVFKGKVISNPHWEDRYKKSWTDSEFANIILNTHWASHSLAFYYLTKVKFLYYITVSYVQVNGQREINVTYTDALLYRGPRTVSRFMYLLHCRNNNKRDWTLRFHDLARRMKHPDAEPYIMVEIIESLNTFAILLLLAAFIAVSLAIGIAAYGFPTKDWSGGFGLSSLILACLASLLAVAALNQYLGMGRLIDDDIMDDSMSGTYRTHYADEVLRKRARSV